jgi:hypothetical protein
MAKISVQKQMLAKRCPVVREVKRLRLVNRQKGGPRHAAASCTSGGVLSCGSGCSSGEV